MTDYDGHESITVDTRSGDFTEPFKVAIRLLRENPSWTHVTFLFNGNSAVAYQGDTASSAFHHHQADRSKAIGGVLKRSTRMRYGAR